MKLSNAINWGAGVAAIVAIATPLATNADPKVAAIASAVLVLISAFAGHKSAQ